MARALKHTVEYLPFQAMAETTRMIFAHGRVPHENLVVWGRAFRREAYPFGKVPCLHVAADGATTTVAQSGAIARYAAKLAGVYPSDALACARGDAVFELAQELCTINPLVNCYVGGEHERIKRWYLERLPEALGQLARQLALEEDGPFFGGETPHHGDFNVYHHLNNVRELDGDYDVGVALGDWMAAMEALPDLRAYLDRRPTLVGVGDDPGLVDRAGTFVTQRNPYDKRCALADGLFTFEA